MTSLTTPDLLKVFQATLERLEQSSIDYMVVGSVASILYGEPRLTRDMDLVIEMKVSASASIFKAFNEEEYYLPPEEIITSEIMERGQFNLIHHSSGLKIDLIIRKDSPHSIEEFKRRKRLPFSTNFIAWVASPEDVIIKKLSYYREGGSEKHLRDIRGILAQTEVNSSYLSRWVAELRLEREWKRV